jgi:hypothetical protein
MNFKLSAEQLSKKSIFYPSANIARSNEFLGWVGVGKLNRLEQCKVWISRRLTQMIMFNRDIIEHVCF